MSICKRIVAFFSLKKSMKTIALFGLLLCLSVKMNSQQKPILVHSPLSGGSSQIKFLIFGYKTLSA